MTETTQQTRNDNAGIRPFKIVFPESDLTDLRRRINATTWPEIETVTDNSQGVRLATMQNLARYWGTDYDWHKCEAKLNTLPNFMTEIDGLDIHFIPPLLGEQGGLLRCEEHLDSVCHQRLPRRAVSSPAELG